MELFVAQGSLRVKFFRPFRSTNLQIRKLRLPRWLKIKEPYDNRRFSRGSLVVDRSLSKGKPRAAPAKPSIYQVDLTVMCSTVSGHVDPSAYTSETREVLRFENADEKITRVTQVTALSQNGFCLILKRFSSLRSW
jgi:hypothetical protein